MPVDEPASEYDLAPVAPPAPLWRPLPSSVEPKAPPTVPPAKHGLTPLFMVLAGGLVIGTILYHARFKLDYCPNDAARWNTIYYLVVHHTYEWLPNHGAWWNTKPWKLPRELPPFWTIDMVANRDADGQYHYYSSKPPLLPTCVAGVVIAIESVSAVIEPGVRWVYERLARRDLAEDGDGDAGFHLPTRATFLRTPHFVIPATLILVQAIPFMLFIWVIARQIGEATDSPFVRDFCIAVAALGTYLTPWSITLNNHVIAAFVGFFAVHAALRVWYDGRRGWGWFVVGGLFAGLLCTLELPGLAVTVAVLAALVWKDWRRGLLLAVVFAALPIAAHFYTNYRQLGTFMPAYADVGKGGGLYDFPGSYWVPFPTGGIDGLKEPHSLYLMNLLVGHHGVFLLTPILIFALLGMGRHLRRPGLGLALVVSLILLAAGALVTVDALKEGRIAEALDRVIAPLTLGRPFQLPRGWTLLAPLGVLALVNLGMYVQAPAKPRPMLALLVLLVSAVVIGFYAVTTNNYGGSTQGARWLLWLIPLWLLLLPAGMEWVAYCHRRRAFAYALLLISMLSVGGAFRQPWGESWAHVLFRHLGWINY